MYVDPFWFGFFIGIVASIVALIVLACFIRKEKK